MVAMTTGGEASSGSRSPPAPGDPPWLSIMEYENTSPACLIRPWLGFSSCPATYPGQPGTGYPEASTNRSFPPFQPDVVDTDLEGARVVRRQLGEPHEDVAGMHWLGELQTHSSASVGCARDRL